MGKMKELFMQMRELEPTDMSPDDEYLYELYLKEKHRSPKIVCFMHDAENKLVMLQGSTEQEVLEVIKKHKLEGEYVLYSPDKHLF